MIQKTLLSLLADGEFHSGAVLGEHLSVSRTSVWKALGGLSKYDLKIESIKGKGYRIPGGLDLLDVDDIQGGMSCGIKLLSEIIIFDSLESTNKYLMSSERENVRPYTVCIAEHQSKGCGRRGKKWVSPYAKNLYLSVGFDLSGGVEVLNGLSLVIGIAVVRTLRAIGLVNAKIKWPNDIWVGEDKIAGILVEISGEATTGWRVTAGIGLNVAMTKEEGVDIDQSWTTVGRYSDVKRSELTGRFMESLITVLELYKDKGFAVFKSEWKEYDLLLGRHVSLSVGGVNGIACGIDEAGRLNVKVGEAIQCVNAGEVSVRPK